MHFIPRRLNNGWILKYEKRKRPDLGIWSQSKSIAPMMTQSRFRSIYISTNYMNEEYYCIFQAGAVEFGDLQTKFNF